MGTFCTAPSSPYGRLYKLLPDCLESRAEQTSPPFRHGSSCRSYFVRPAIPFQCQGSPYLWLAWCDSLNRVRLRLSFSLALRYIHLIVTRYSVYGINVLQAYIYFHNSTKGSVHMRYFVSDASYIWRIYPNIRYTDCVPVVREINITACLV